jgi:tape measure domain-containing protein
MAETNEFYIKIGADVDDAMNKLNRLSSQLSQLASNTQKSSSQIGGSMGDASKMISQAFGAMGVALTTAGITTAIIGIGKSALTTAAQLEQITVSFEVFTGSAEVAKNMLADLKNQALKSPMQFQDITKGAQTLLQYGLTAQQVVPITRMLGDVSGGNADRFQRLSLAFGQVNAAGRLMGQEARQMINAGFNPLKAISDSTGESMASLTQRMHDGQISVKDVGDAFISATSEGGQFFGMADRQSLTLQGQFNKLSESVTFALAEIGNSLANAFDIKGAVSGILTFMNDFKTAMQSNKDVAELFSLAVNGITTVIKILSSALIGLINLWQGLVKVFMFMVNNVYKPIVDFWTNIYKKVYEFIGGIQFLGKILDWLIGKFTKIDNAKPIQLPKVDDSKLTGLSETPSKINKNKKTEKVEVIVGTDFQTKEYGTHLKKLMQMSSDAVAEINNIGLTGSKKKLAELIDAFNKEKAEFQRYGIDTTNITRNYLLKAAQLQGEIEAERKGALMSLLDKSINTGWLKNLNQYLKSDLGKFNDTINEFVVNTNAKKIAVYGESMTSALNDFGVNIFTGFSNIAGSALAGISAFGDAIAQVGSMFLNLIGDLLIQMGTSAIKLGLSAETIQAVLESIGLPGGGVAAIAAGTLAVAAGSLLKGLATKTDSAISAKSNGNSVDVKNGSVSSKASGASYSYGGASYATQSIRLAIDLTGAITATQTGYQINKSLETTLRVTGR